MNKPLRPTPTVLRGLAIQHQRHMLLPPRLPAAETPAGPKPVNPAVAKAIPEPRPMPEHELEAARAQGLREGREAGLAQGLKDAQARIDEAVRTTQAALQAQAARDSEAAAAREAARAAQVQSIVGALQRAFDERLERLEDDAAALALAAVGRVLGDAPGRRETVVALVRQALGQVREQPLRVRLHATDLALLRSLPGALPDLAGSPGLQWLADDSVAAGGCLIDSDSGTLDARLDEQLQRLVKAWKAALAGPEAPR